jgi:hypothetical protein
MSNDNPYASPQAPVHAQLLEQSPFSGPAGGLWRKGSVLVMHSMATLPARCIKSNQPASGWLKRKLAWHHPAVFLAILAGLLIYIILALILTKRATIHVALSEEWFVRRRNAIIVGWSLVLLSIALFIIGIGIADQSDVGAGLILVSIMLFLIGALYGLLRARIVTPQRISDQYVWLKGVHPAILADLPPWPYNP